MIETATLIGIAIVLVAIVIAFLWTKSSKKRIESLEEKAKSQLKEAEHKAQDLLQDAQKKIQEKERSSHQMLLEKEKMLAEKVKSERESLQTEYKAQCDALLGKEQSFKEECRKLESDRNAFTKKEVELELLTKDLNERRETLAQKEQEIEEALRLHRATLETISGLSAEEAKKSLVESLTIEAKEQAQADAKEMIEEVTMEANQKAKKIIIQSIQRVATETAIENAITTFHIDNDEMKGRIIGREGRNIRALEAATGVEIIVDDTPETIVLSGFDPVRREVARLALHRLVQDGRIHPARIEEVVEKVKKQIEEEIIETGKRTLIDLGIHGMHPDLVRLIGKMKYRSSYGQNLLQHSRETANLCATMASELGLNPKKAKRAGLLHDIGKVPDEEPELPHALLGMKLCQQYKEKPDICNAVGAHHDEVEMETLIAPIVQVCDAISGARPGARREIVEAYIKRLNDLEKLALSYPGVKKTYAIQAGRELRVIVGAEQTDDDAVEELSQEIAQRIQDEMTYPGQVKITVIRETRAVSYAK